MRGRSDLVPKSHVAQPPWILLPVACIEVYSIYKFYVNLYKTYLGMCLPHFLNCQFFFFLSLHTSVTEACSGHIEASVLGGSGELNNVFFVELLEPPPTPPAVGVIEQGCYWSSG